jgi:hypothetical protein
MWMSLLPAAAAELDVGVGAAVAMDLPDEASGEYARFGPGPSAQVPIRLRLTDGAWLRASLRGDAGFGSSRVEWQGAGDVVYADDQWDARFFAGAATLGPEFRIPLGGLGLTLGAEAGAALVRTDHALPDNGRFANIDRKNLASLAVLSDLHLGLLGGEGVGWFSEAGYSVAWVEGGSLGGQAGLVQAPWGWNALRLGGGIRFSL